MFAIAYFGQARAWRPTETGFLPHHPESASIEETLSLMAE